MFPLFLFFIGTILPFQDANPEKIRRFRDVIILEGPVTAVESDRGKGEVLDGGKDLSLSLVPSGSSKVQVMGEN